MAKIILVTGLSGSGKTTFCHELLKHRGMDIQYINNDDVRNQTGNYDFSPDGRLRQMQNIIERIDHTYSVVLLDVIAPYWIHKKLLNPDYTVYMNTQVCSRYLDTDKIYEPPIKPDFEIKHFAEIESTIENLIRVICEI